CSDTYIKQYKHPLVIYSPRSVMVSSINFLLPFAVLILWQLIIHFNLIHFSVFAVLLALPVFFFIAWPLATITSFITTKFRDFMQIITVVFQVLWYASPVFLRPEMFINAHRGYLLEYNPIYHVMNLVRIPLMEGTMPHLVDYISALSLGLVLWLIAIRMIVKQERKIIFYL
ncbi:MAG: ABC transporter permease, partial [Gammaproteobacteria bacterium]